MNLKSGIPCGEHLKNLLAKRKSVLNRLSKEFE